MDNLEMKPERAKKLIENFIRREVRIILRENKSVEQIFKQFGKNKPQIMSRSSNDHDIAESILNELESNGFKQDNKKREKLTRPYAYIYSNGIEDVLVDFKNKESGYLTIRLLNNN